MPHTLLVLQIVLTVPALLLALPDFEAHRRLTDGLTAGTGVQLTGSLLDTGCHAPREEGQWGFCGPASCKEAYITCAAEGGGPATVVDADGNSVTGSMLKGGCEPYLPRTEAEDLTLSQFQPRGQCDASCAQETSGVCSSAFLARVLRGAGVKHAYCNDRWLVVTSDGSPGSLFTPNLNDVPYPPGATVARAGKRRTGMASLDLTRVDELFYPLSVRNAQPSNAEADADAPNA